MNVFKIDIRLLTFFCKIATIAHKLQNRGHLCLYCERNLEKGRQSTEGAGIREGWTHIMAPNAHIPDICPPRWIVILSPGCARNINKDGTRFGVCVRSW